MAGKDNNIANGFSEDDEVIEEEVEAPPRRRSGGYGASDTQAGGARFRPRRSVCTFCVDKVKRIDYKDVSLLVRFLDDYGKIKAGRKTGTCAKHQRRLAVAIKRARHLALLPFSSAGRYSQPE